MKILLLLLAVLWLAAAVGGVVYLGRFENKPADANVDYPAIFPAASRIAHDPERTTLIFFAHPKCPYTRASLRELAKLMTNLDGKLQASVVFSKPKDTDEGWTETDLYESARSIPNVDVIIDRDDRETDLFNAQTSGLTLVYDPSGGLQFDGGITAARGHEGDNAGSSAIYNIVKENAPRAESPVFGCPIHKKDCLGEPIANTQ